MAGCASRLALGDSLVPITMLYFSCCRSPILPGVVGGTDADAPAETGGDWTREATSCSIQACCSGVNIGGPSAERGSSMSGVAIVRLGN